MSRLEDLRTAPTATPWAHLLAASERAVAGVAALGEAAPRRAAAVVQGLFAAAGARGAGRSAERLARGWGRPSAAADLTAALVLSADHELNISSFTARCVASADAPPSPPCWRPSARCAGAVTAG